MSGIPTITPYPLPGPDEIPPNTAAWRADPRRAILLVHDMQHYFVRPFPEPMRGRLVDRIDVLRRAAVAAGVPVAYTAQPGDMTEDQRGLLRDFWGPGMRTAAADRLVVSPLEPGAGDEVFTKWRYSAFAHSDLLERMRARGRDQLVVCGVYAHVGVLMTAVEAFTHDIETFVVADGVADFSARHHRLALGYAASRCAVVACAEQLAADLTADLDAEVSA